MQAIRAHARPGTKVGLAENMVNCIPAIETSANIRAAEIATREDAAALTASIVAMAKALWLRVVAEGVEKEAERELVAIWGCEQAQGYLFSRPVPADEAADLWRTRAAGTAVENSAG